MVFRAWTINPNLISMKNCIRKCVKWGLSKIQNFYPNLIKFNQFLKPILTNLRHGDFFKSWLDGKSIKSCIIQAISPVVQLRFD